MLSKQTFTFLQKLAKNNNKAWYEANRVSYQSAKTDFQQMVIEIWEGIAAFDPDIALLDPVKCIFRQNRDVRFSKDKSPYKIHMGAYFNRGSKKVNTPGYYVHLQPGKSFIAGGWYQPEAPLLAKIRQEIDYNASEWTALLEHKTLRKHFTNVPDFNDTLVRPPKGYDEDNPMIKFLKLKSFVITNPLTDDQFSDNKGIKQIHAAFASLYPFIQFLNRSAE